MLVWYRFSVSIRQREGRHRNRVVKIDEVGPTGTFLFSCFLSMYPKGAVLSEHELMVKKIEKQIYWPDAWMQRWSTKLNEWFTQKWKLAENKTLRPSKMQMFFSSLEQICRNLPLHHQWILSKGVPSEWVFRQLIKHHNTRHNSSPSVNVLWSKMLHIYMKQI